MTVQKLTLQFLTSVTGVSALEDTQRQRTENLWDFHTPLRVKIQLATFITVTEAGQVWVEKCLSWGDIFIIFIHTLDTIHH